MKTKNFGDVAKMKKIKLSVLFLFFIHSNAWSAFLQCPHIPQLFATYFHNHYSFTELNDEIKKRTLDLVVKNLDPLKTIFTQDDVNWVKTEAGKIFESSKKGDCTALTTIHDRYLARVKENEAFAKSILNKEYKLDKTVELILDPEKRIYSKTDNERKDYLKKMIHFQMANLIVSDIQLEEAKKQLIHRYELSTKRTKERVLKDEIETFVGAFAMSLDPHSSFLSQEDLEDFKIQMQLSLQGIGASLSSQNGFTVIEEVLPGGAAEKLKILQPKDKILAVAQGNEKPVSVIDMQLRDVVKLIRGKKGTRVKLSILREKENNKRFEVSIVRDKIDIKEQEAKLEIQTKKVGNKKYKLGIIDLPSFYGSNTRSCYKDVKKLIQKANKQKIDGLVLNLFRNGGGVLEEAVNIGGLFIKEGGIVATKSHQKQIQRLEDDDVETNYSGPMVILTSRISASASEIVAGALKDYSRVVIVGSDHTFGKGSVQALSELPFGLGAMKVTAGLYFLPGGQSTQHQGVNADVVLPTEFDQDELGEKSLDYSLPEEKISAFLSENAKSTDPKDAWKEPTAEMIKKLSEKSAERVKTSKKFTEIKENLAKASDKKLTFKIAELFQKDKKEDAKKKAKRDEESREDRAKAFEAPYIEESTNVLADLIGLMNLSSSKIAVSSK